MKYSISFVKFRFVTFWIISCIIMIIVFNAFEPMKGVSWRTNYDPIIWDGKATSFDEWGNASRYPDWFNDGNYPNAGFFYQQHKLGWQATSLTGNSTYYSEMFYFLAHDIEGEPEPSIFNMFRERNTNDWNSAEFEYQGIKVKCWIFGGEDQLVDTAWIKLTEGLENSSLIPEVGGYDLINDAESSFIVRFNDDPSTDVHWFPGNPQPGDPLWNWDDWYGCFGSYGFNNSFYTTGIDLRFGYEGENEVYEWVYMKGSSLIDSTEISWSILDPPKDTIIFKAPNWEIHLIPPGKPNPYEFSCIPCQNLVGNPGDTVEVNFYIRNDGFENDTYMGTVTSYLGWNIEPMLFSDTLLHSEWHILPFKVSLPPSYRSQTDTITMTINSLGSPGLTKSAGMLLSSQQSTEINDHRTPFIANYKILTCYPNPLNTFTKIMYSLERESFIQLRIFNLEGDEIITLLETKQNHGDHSIIWDGEDKLGNPVNDGIYLIQLNVKSKFENYSIGYKILTQLLH
jgi:hypothetical protein